MSLLLLFSFLLVQQFSCYCSLRLSRPAHSSPCSLRRASRSVLGPMTACFVCQDPFFKASAAACASILPTPLQFLACQNSNGPRGRHDLQYSTSQHEHMHSSQTSRVSPSRSTTGTTMPASIASTIDTNLPSIHSHLSVTSRSMIEINPSVYLRGIMVY